MINLLRTKEHKWIFQKNISSANQMFEFLDAAKNYGDYANPQLMLKELKERGVYKGRSTAGASNTFGVRRSEMKFYMFGYSYPQSKKSTFYQSPMTKSIFKDSSPKNVSKMSLINLFSIQFPHPFSDTDSCFQIYVGRLILKLLTDERINKKLYIDEFCYFLPFMEKVNESIYEELISSIIEYRSLSFYQKSVLFKSVENFDDVFSNVFHECNYYFLRIFQQLGVLEIYGDSSHNDGNLFRFNHGNCGTKRTDAYKSGAKISGYIKIADDLYDDVIDLISVYSPFAHVLMPSDPEMRSNEDFINELYNNRPLNYLALLDEYFEYDQHVNTVINNMLRESRYGTRDGRSFESALRDLFELFDQSENVEIISGSGNTDVLCCMRDEDDSFYKINIDAKMSSSSTSALNSSRLTHHLELTGSKYCIVVSPRFSSGVRRDIYDTNIVAIEAEVLANYCFCLFNKNNNESIDYSLLNQLILNNLGKNISSIVQNQIDQLYEL